MHPLLILAIGVAVVIGLILFLRINAFVALITAAIVVSLLAPGAVAEKISRVAQAFGTSAGQIGIVIALAAIIGECMMVSGAADRIVQGFLRLLGEKRAPWALMSSGFVLAVPVFFDTVFYLLVPLARSLYKRTGRNYLLSLLAISAGGAITHTLVPPTPGPLIMAANLNLDVGTMILVGGIVAIPAAVVGLLLARFLDRKVEVPFRELATEAEVKPLADNQLPSLFLSVLPVVLPVLMISTNTALSTLADNQGVAQLSVDTVTDWSEFEQQLAAAGEDEPSPAARLMELLSNDLSAAVGSGLSDEQQQEMVNQINVMLASKNPWLYDDESFDSVVEPRWKIEQKLAAAPAPDEEAELQRQLLLDDMLAKDRNGFKRHERERFQRVALEVAFPDVISPHVYETPTREAADIASLFGNANLALLFSAVAALYLYWLQRNPTLTQMGRTVETSLMSGGAIILITAGGGAFGAMLKAAQIGPTIEAMFQSDGDSAAAGLMFLVLGYVVAAMLKVAQGSSTVAMITASAMLAAAADPTALGFHPVYLATAIGAGSLMGSWMNDSGFWIFAKMGGLTELEALKSWTILLAALSVTSLITTVILAIAMPMAG